MKNLFTSAFLVVCVSTVFAQYTAIPDPNFEQRLIALGWDDVLDGQVLTANISNRTSLNVSDRGITDLTGIKDFTSLTTLNCSLNPINNLDLSGMTNLQTLWAEGNAGLWDCYSCTKCISNIKLIGCTSLTSVNAPLSQVKTIELDCPNLTYLDCNRNELSSIDLSLTPNLSFLSIGNDDYFSNNCSSYIDVNLSNVPLLETLKSSWVTLPSFDFTNNPKLKVLELWNSGTNNLDISSCSNLEALMIKDYRDSLVFDNNTILNKLILHLFDGDFVDASMCDKISNLSVIGVKEARLNFTSYSEFTMPEPIINNIDCLQIFGASVSVVSSYDLVYEDRIGYIGTEPCNFTNVPDYNFEEALINLGYDAVQNGSVTSQAIQAVTSLNVSNKNITDFTGLEGFSSIESLDISGNLVANLDFANSILKTPANSTLQTLNISNSPNLISLNLSTNDKLTSISASNNPVLENMKLNFKVLNTGSSDIVNNPNLECIQVFDKDASTITTGTWIDSQITLTNSSCNPLGINETNNTIGIVPNPFSAEIHLRNFADVASLNVFDINGRLLVSINNPSKTIDLSHLENGTYFIQIITKQHFKYHSQIIKQ